MTQEQWQRIADLYQMARAREPESRSVFLREICGEDEELRKEVESLLQRDVFCDGVLERIAEHVRFAAAVDGSGSDLSAQPLPALSDSHPDAESFLKSFGGSFGSYELKALLGAGGMGQVYRAWDSKLKRHVAVKVLPTLFSSDTERVARFQREAEILASLNHPHIAAIYGMEEFGDFRFLVLELVEGETLADRLARGPIAIPEALPIAMEIAEALEAAHGKGIVHRDVKPSNVKITLEGKVKVLDFGLAKGTEPPTESAFSNSPKLMPDSTPGMILGTAAYMSPEQARGKKVDRAADIWAFGCVLYEMLTGKPPFAGETVVDVLGRIVTNDPDWTALPEMTPPMIRSLLRRLMQKDPNHRLRDIADARLEIEEIVSVPLPAGDVASPPAHKAKVAWIAAVLAVTASGLLIIPALRYLRETPPEIRVNVITPPTTDPASFAISPDGQRLVFVASNESKSQLWIRPLDSLAAMPLAGTDGASYPFWSPDGSSLGFFADAKLKRIDITGAAPQVLANATSGRGGTWNREGVIVFAPAALGPLYKIPRGGGELVPVTRLESGQSNHRFPEFLPDGRHFIYFVQGSPSQGVYLGSLDGTSSRRLASADASAVISPAGFLLFPKQMTLLAQAFDFSKQELSGSPFTVADGVIVDGSSASGFSATSGVVSYRTANADTRQLTWLDRSGKTLSLVGRPDTGALNDVELSLDGKRVAVQRSVNGNLDIWVVDTTRGVPTRFTFDAANDAQPLWSPDGSRVVFQSNRTGVFDIYGKLSSGTGAEELLLESNQTKAPVDWSSDGRFLLFRSLDPQTGFDLWVLPLSGTNASLTRSASAIAPSLEKGRSDQTIPADKKPFPFLKTPFEEREGQFSPNGKWIAYESNESGRFEIYVRPFPGLGPQFQISTSGGSQVRWNPNGREIFYVSLDSKLMAVPVKLSANGQSLETGMPVALFPVHIAGGPLPGINKQQYAVSRDGQRFLINLAADQATASPISIIFNWKPKVH